MGSLFERMRADHHHVLAELAELEAAADSTHDRQAGDLVRLLEQQFETHMRIEDEVLYPALAAALPEVQASLAPLREEHAELRAMLANLALLLESEPSPVRSERIAVEVRDLGDLLRIHVRKEESLVLHLSERLLAEPEVARAGGTPVAQPGTTRRGRRGPDRMRRMLRMKPICLAAFGLALALAAAGCGGNASTQEKSSPAVSGASANPSGGSLLDQGPRAAESAVDEALAEAGEKLFQEKGCSACHAFGQRATGPDLKGVSQRRTAKWIETQILHPEKMTKEDPIARQLFAQFALQMPNQGLTEAEARAVIEFFKHQDHEAGESHD